MRTLDMLNPGEKACITNILGKQTPLRRRLLDLGLTPSTNVEMVRHAVLGDPLEIKIRGYHLTLRKSDAINVEID